MYLRESHANLELWTRTQHSQSTTQEPGRQPTYSTRTSISTTQQQSRRSRKRPLQRHTVTATPSAPTTYSQPPPLMNLLQLMRNRMRVYGGSTPAIPLVSLAALTPSQQRHHATSSLIESSALFPSFARHQVRCGLASNPATLRNLSFPSQGDHRWGASEVKVRALADASVIGLRESLQSDLRQRRTLDSSGAAVSQRLTCHHWSVHKRFSSCRSTNIPDICCTHRFAHSSTHRQTLLSAIAHQQGMPADDHHRNGGELDGNSGDAGDGESVFDMGELELMLGELEPSAETSRRILRSFCELKDMTSWHVVPLQRQFRRKLWDRALRQKRSLTHALMHCFLLMRDCVNWYVLS